MPLRYRREGTAGWADARAGVLGWVKALVADDEDSAISLSANLCGHAACSGEEIVILFMRRGERPIALRIAKSVETVAQADSSRPSSRSCPHTLNRLR
jgi:hypothetical protein